MPEIILFYINELCGDIELKIELMAELLQEVVKLTILKASPMRAKSELLPDPEAPEYKRRN